MKAAADAVHEVAPHLYLIALDQQALTGFTDFICAWLYRGEATFLVDVGPAATIPRLCAELTALGVHTLDAVLLTHVHIAHAGGIGDLLNFYADPPVVCHEKAIPHLIDPSRLWEGSLKTLGDTARAYGPIQPVAADRIVGAAATQRFGVTGIPTPGHAPHHVSFLVEKILFAGEAGGVCLHLPGGGIYLRPATPPRFFMETHLASVERLLQVPHEQLCYGHFGMTRRTPELLEAHRQQLHRWAAIIAPLLVDQTADAFLDRCRQRLLANDPLLAGFSALPLPVRQRENGFLNNSIRGFVGYLNELGAGSAERGTN